MILIAATQDYTDGQLKVLVHHNSNSKLKHLTKADLQAYDVIMISCMNLWIYPWRHEALLTSGIDSGLESIHRKEWKGWNRSDGILKEDSK